MKRLMAAFALVVLVAGCSKANSPPEGKDSTPTPTASVPAANEASPGSTPSAAPAETPSPSATQTKAGSSPQAQQSPTASSMPLVIEYATRGSKSKVWAPSFKLCVTHGQKVAITLRTAPNARIFLIAAYSDGDPHGSHEFGDASPGGTYEWDWVVPPEAPTGDGTFVATASAHESANQHRPFKVARSC